MAPQWLKDSEIRAELKAALREWLDEQFAAVGKWTLRGLAAMGLSALVWLILTANGWHK